MLPAPPWMLMVDAIELKDIDHARRLAGEHREKVESLEKDHLKLTYFSGVLDAQVMIEAEHGSSGS